VYALLVFALIMSAVCFTKTSGADVQAANEYGSFDTDTYENYALADYTGTIVKSYIGQKAPVVEGYLFAGWFTGKECTLEQGVKTKGEILDGSTYYAKFVPEGVLNVKAQVSTDDVSSDDSVDTRNIRFVSSVDTLNYSRIGFSLTYEENGTPVTKTNSSKDVFKRIASATASDEYEFAPKVVNTKSEYFMTATWKGTDNKGIAASDSTGFYVKAYWKTLDGVQVFGPSRYVTVSQGLDTKVINMPIKNSDLKQNDNVTVTYEGADPINGTVIYTDGVYAHISFSLGETLRKDLPSATTFTIKNSVGTLIATEVYRNFYREAPLGTADTSWWNGMDTEFVIASAADLYGFASVLTNQDNFASDKIYLVKDIEINSGTIKDMSAEEKATLTPWTPMGKTGKVFVGKFDGQGCKISGLYSSSNTNYTGLFAQTGANAEIRNLTLSNSYFENTNASAYGVGSMVGLVVGGTFDSLHCTNDVVVESTGVQTGGIIGRLSLSNAVYNVNNCWFAGQVNVSGTASKSVYCGGIIGCVVQGTLNLSNCLNTGNVSYTCTVTPSTNLMVGGLCGGTMNATAFLNMSNCFNVGTVSAPIESGVAGLLGYGNNVNTTEGKYQWTFNNCYVLDTSCATGFYKVKDGTKASKTNTDFVSNTDNAIEGHQSYTSALSNLGFYSNCKSDTYTEESHPYWVVNEEGMPTLKDFTTDWIDVGWYYENVTEGADTFAISTAEELYGFSAISQDITFAGDTVQLENNIDVNDAIVSVCVVASIDNSAGIRTWTPIGNASNIFAGTFDGNNKTIAGVYVNTTDIYGGFFGYVGHGSTIKNFRFVDSYIYVNNTAGEVGSIAGRGAGTFENIYSNAIVASTQNRAGGIVGRFQDVNVSASSYTSEDDNNGWIKQCWFDGSVTVYNSSAYAGGIVAAVLNGKVEISNCLNTGKITTGQYAAGLCGRVQNNAYLVITDSVGAGNGNITGGSKTYASVLAGATGSTGLELTNVFATEESANKQYLANIPTTVNSTGFVTGVSENDITITQNNNWVVNISGEKVATIVLGTCGR